MQQRSLDPVAPPAATPEKGASSTPALLRQCWNEVVFLHWRVDPGAVAPLLPPGTRPDELAGTTHVGLVAFRVARPRALGVVPTGEFNEVNVRLYSRDGHGRRGVVFVTMDADALPSVVTARALTGVPYIWSDIALWTGDAATTGGIRRRAPGPPAVGRWRVTIGDPIAEPTPEQRFLTARYGLHTRHLGRTRWLPAIHPPWQLFTAELGHYEGNLLAAAGVDVDDRRPDSVLWSPGTTATFHRPRR